MIQTWIADVSALREQTVYAKYYQSVPEFRRQKADKLRRQADRALSVGAWWLFEQMKREYHLQEDVVYNLSHSGTMVLCVVEDTGLRTRQLGCDVEHIGVLRKKVAERFFCPSELETILFCRESEQAEAFYRLWVLKESYIKATRKGMQLDLRSFEIGFSEGNEPYLKQGAQAFPGPYYFREYRIEDAPYRIAVCADCDVFAGEIRKLTLEGKEL
ncbi:MAG: 4'-phosphopantetheinyl transferase superfamily protein [Faecalimonas sp.]|nr:4'-phosphopantetheinyl transferase superfamily protein [Faecalimonas sp.]